MINYYKLFELANLTYNIDKAQLKKAYLGLQAKYHPDQAKDSAEKVKFMELSSNINQGYKSLMDDYLRAEHILLINGLRIDDEHSKNILENFVLEEIWELNQQLSEIEDLKDLYNFEKQILAKCSDITLRLVKIFSENSLQKALELTIKLKYLTNLVKNSRIKIKHANS